MRKTPLESWISSKIAHVCGNSLTRSALAKYQLEKLKETIDYARLRSPFYRRHLAGFSGDRLKRLADLSQAPFTVEQDLLSDGLQFLCVSQGEIARVVTLQSSGTTAPPKRLYFTEEDLELTTDFFHHGMSTFVEPGQKVLILMPGDRPGSVGDLLVKGLLRMNAAGIAHGLVQDPGAVIEQIVREEIDCLVGIPVQVLAVAKHPDSSLVPPSRIKSVLLSTDYLPVALVSQVESAWGCTVFDHYGATEMGLGGGVECEALSGYHLREADLYFEIINPENGETVPDGESGEIVFTTLTRKGMPLIRYRTGDMAKFLPDTCPCGTVLKTMARVKGRLKERVNLGQGRWLSITDLDEALFSIAELINYRAAVTSENARNSLEIEVYIYSGDKEDVVTAVERNLARVPTLAGALAEGTLTLQQIRFSNENWLNSSFGKRKIAYRTAEPVSL